MKNKRKIRIETLAVHAGHAIDAATGAVATPIHLSTTFERDAEGGYPHGFSYGRSANPNRQALEQGLAALEGGRTRPRLAPAWPRRARSCKRWPRAITSSRRPMFITE